LLKRSFKKLSSLCVCHCLGDVVLPVRISSNFESFVKVLRQNTSLGIKIALTFVHVFLSNETLEHSKVSIKLLKAILGRLLSLKEVSKP
jgi:hypothetical protein